MLRDPRNVPEGDVGRHLYHFGDRSLSELIGSCAKSSDAASHSVVPGGLLRLTLSPHKRCIGFHQPLRYWHHFSFPESAASVSPNCALYFLASSNVVI